ncbi:MAG: chromate resistance protein [Candidatus Heimdallarchaeota archaeon]|nr:chromate resistance protein [Candidatus Heimdallarchaeota archaeon]
MIWVTRNYVHVDRVACPWLIKRFVDKNAQFIFLPKEEITEFVNKTGAIPYDTGTGIELDHYEKNSEKFCTFDAIIEKYNLTNDKALAKLRLVVRSADTGRLDESPLALALEVVASGAPLLGNSDHDALELEFPFYDILYTYFKREIILEEYKSEIDEMKNRGERREFIKFKLRQIK